MPRARLLPVILAALVVSGALALPFAGSQGNGHGQGQAGLRVDVTDRPPRAHPPDLAANDDQPGAPGVHVNPVGNGNRVVAVDVRAEDGNGHNDVRRVTVTVFKPDNSTVHVSTGSAERTGGQGKRATFTYAFPMAYHDPPGEYHVRAEAEGRGGRSDTSWGTFHYESLAALGVEDATVTLNPGGNTSGVVAPGADTLADPSTVTIANTGNVPVTLEHSGTDLVDAAIGATLAVGSVNVALDASMAPRWAVDETPQVLTDFRLNPGPDSAAPVYFAVQVPTGVPAGTYRGELTLAAVPAQ